MNNVIDDDMISCWRVNYNLDKHTPADAARWWNENNHGQCPAGAVAALGMCLIEIERLREDAARLDWLEKHHDGFHNIDRITSIVGKGFNRMPTLRAAIDEAMKAPFYDAVWHDVPMPVDYTCVCGIHVHPIRRKPWAIHDPGCPYSEKEGLLV